MVWKSKNNSATPGPVCHGLEDPKTGTLRQPVRASRRQPPEIQPQSLLRRGQRHVGACARKDLGNSAPKTRVTGTLKNTEEARLEHIDHG